MDLVFEVFDIHIFIFDIHIFKFNKEWWNLRLVAI